MWKMRITLSKGDEVLHIQEITEVSLSLIIKSAIRWLNELGPY